MDTITIPAAFGTVLVAVVDIIHRLFPQLNGLALRVIAIVLCAVVAVVLTLASGNADVQKVVQNIITTLGANQAFFALLWGGSDAQKRLAGTTDNTK